MMQDRPRALVSCSPGTVTSLVISSKFLGKRHILVCVIQFAASFLCILTPSRSWFPSSDPPVEKHILQTLYMRPDHGHMQICTNANN